MGIQLKGCLTARWLWSVAAVGLVLVGAPRTTIAADGKDKPDGRPSRHDVFETGRVWNVHITVPAAEYEAMQPRRGQTFLGMLGMGGRKKTDQPQREVHRNTFGMDLPWATASVTFDGETFQDVGIRYKGNGTIGDASRTIKKSFKIDLDHSGGTARFRGLKTVNLHCGVADPSKCRESMGYGLYRAAGVPASLTALAEVRLTVPGKYDRELLGLYTVVEQVDKPFLREHFGADTGLLMKPEGLRDFEYKGDNWDRYQKQYLPKRDAEPEEIARVIAFARLVDKAGDDEFQKEIESYLDVDAYLRFLAVTAFVANSDSFFVLGHNYYLYLHPTTGKFHFIPWDLDRAFANFFILGSNEQQMNLSFTHPYGGEHRLTDRLLAMPGVAEKYQKLLKDLAAKCFEKDRLLKELDATQAAVKDLLARDAKAAEARKEGTGGFGPPGMFGKPPDLKTFMEKRTESLAAQHAGKSKGYVPTGGFGWGGFGPPGGKPVEPKEEKKP
jgi:spore coat protein H